MLDGLVAKETTGEEGVGWVKMPFVIDCRDFDTCFLAVIKSQKIIVSRKNLV